MSKLSRIRKAVYKNLQQRKLCQADLKAKVYEVQAERFLSAFFTSCMCPPLVYIFGDPKVMFETHKIYSLSKLSKLSIIFQLLSSHSLAEVIGIRRPGLEAATVLPLGLTMVLFLGPITMVTTTHL